MVGDLWKAKTEKWPFLLSTVTLSKNAGDLATKLYVIWFLGTYCVTFPL